MWSVERMYPPGPPYRMLPAHISEAGSAETPAPSSEACLAEPPGPSGEAGTDEPPVPSSEACSAETPAAPSGEAGAAKERRQAADGEAYTMQEFLDYYGESVGRRYWDACQQGEADLPAMPECRS